jgi:hypothetical protein
VRPGDLSPGDLFPTEPDDLRLEPGYTGGDALEEADTTASTAAPLRPEQWQLGLGREQVLSAYGRDVATERWWDGEFGPDSPMAKAAPAPCSTCGFLLPVGGLVGQAFGVCTNAFGADGRVVALGYGCGAHSSVRAVEGTGVPVTDIVVDELRADELDVLSPSDEVAAPEADPVATGVVDDDEVVVVDLDAEDPPVEALAAETDETVDADDAPAEAVDEADEVAADDDSDDDSDDEDPDDEDPAVDAVDEDDIEDIEPDEVLA